MIASTLTASLASETLVEHEYGINHNQMDDGYSYEPRPIVAPSNPRYGLGV